MPTARPPSGPLLRPGTSPRARARAVTRPSADRATKPTTLDRACLTALLGCHSTPGDEAEVAAVLTSAWRAARLDVTAFGSHAVVGRFRSRETAARRPVLLITAHMDSPGFAVDRLHLPPTRASRTVRKDAVGLTRLGGACFPGRTTPALLKTRAGRFPVTVCRDGSPGREPDFRCEWAAGTRSRPAGLAHGDRVCFAPNEKFLGNRVRSAFLDNRLGCWVLAELVRLVPRWNSRFQVVVGATGSEELGGFGATVLAQRVQPDLVVVVDATYVAPDQGVTLGGGPVLTLSDASVLLSPTRRDQLAALFHAAGVPLQTEVYNYSGTDARAFPRVGLPAPVFPLLLPTTGNHSPCETADLRDAQALTAGLRCLAENVELAAEVSATRTI